MQEDPMADSPTPLSGINRQTAAIRWLENHPDQAPRMRNGGFYIRRGTLVPSQAGGVREALEALIELGFSTGMILAGYSVQYTPPGGPYPEKFAFFPVGQIRNGEEREEAAPLPPLPAIPDIDRMIRTVRWLENNPGLTSRMRNGGFFIRRGSLLPTRDGDRREALGVLALLGFGSGTCVGGYSIAHTVPGGPYPEKYSFFPDIRNQGPDFPVSMPFSRSSTPGEILAALPRLLPAQESGAAVHRIRRAPWWELQDGTLVQPLDWLLSVGICPEATLQEVHVTHQPTSARGEEQLLLSFPGEELEATA